MPIKPPAARPLLEPLRDSLRECLGVPCFVRRCRQPDALLASDLPRRVPDPEPILVRLAATGRWLYTLRDGLLLLDPSTAAWHTLITEAPRSAPRQQEAYPAYPFLAACALRLAARETDPADHPIALLRRTLKRLDAGEFALLQDELPAAFAVLLRRHEPPPTAAGLYTLDALWQAACASGKNTMKGSELIC